MVNWKYIATHLAKGFSTIGIGGHYTKEHLAQCWYSLFDYPVQPYANPFMRENLAAMYNLFMTLANLPSITDAEKATKILALLKVITGGYNQNFVEEVFKDGGYELNLPAAEPKRGGVLSSRFHNEVIQHCSDYFKDAHYSACVNEACKAYNKAVQKKSGSSRDGQDLMFWAYGKEGNLRINKYQTESEENEQEGVKFLSVGLMRGFRNPTAHELKEDWKFSKDDCLEILNIVSYLFKQLDKAKTNSSSNPT
jgi:uncharacterized protein (TIGR02391 family)